nr:xylulose kinase-1 [Tanacetum cinerariifolium]
MIKVLPPKTAKEVVARERERKARTTFLMALPEDHLAKFYKMADVKEMWEAIKSRFGGNDDSKARDNGSDNESMFMNKVCDLDNTPVNDRYAERMHTVPPLLTRNYMPSEPDVEIDYTKFTYGSKQTSADESDSKPVEYASSNYDTSVETTTSMPTTVKDTQKVVSEPKSVD